MFKPIMLLTTLSFFGLSSAEAVRNGNIFNPDAWFNDFQNIFKRPAAPMIPPGKSHKTVKEAILLDFRDGKKAVYNENALKFNTDRLSVPLVMTPTQIRYGDVLIHRRMSLSQALEGLKNSKIVKKAELRSITASNTEVYTSTRYVVESKKPYKFEEQRRESKSSFDKEKNRQRFLNKKTQEFDRDLASFLNATSLAPAQPKVQAKPVAKPRVPARRTSVKAPVKPVAPARVTPVKVQTPASPRKRIVAPAKTPAKAGLVKAQPKAVAKPKTPVVPVKVPAKSVTPTKIPAKVAPAKAPAKATPVKAQTPASPRKRIVAPAHQNTHQDIKKRRMTTREIHKKRSAARRAIGAKRPAVQRNTRTRHFGSRRRR